MNEYITALLNNNEHYEVQAFHNYESSDKGRWETLITMSNFATEQEAKDRVKAVFSDSDVYVRVIKVYAMPEY